MTGGRRATLVSLVVLAALVAAILLWQRPFGDRPAEPVPALDERALVPLFSRLAAAGDAEEFAARAGDTPEARRWAREAWSHLEQLEGGGLRFGFVRVGAPLGDGLTAVEATVSWEPGDFLASRRARDVTVTFGVRASEGGYAIEKVVAAAGAMPLWLAGALRVHADEHTTVVTVDGGPARHDIVAETRRAHRTVTAALGTTSRLVVLAPADIEGAAALIGRPASELRQIAAVTTVLDGLPDDSGAATVVVVNPGTFDPMDERASRVVLAHEAVHALTDAVGRGVEPWLAEGFADYIALREDDTPIETSAAQILDRVRRHGPPSRLPTAADFANDAHGLGASYEAAWLAVRHLAEGHGHDAVVALYRAVAGGQSVDAALADLGTDRAALTEGWIAELRRLAD